MYRKGRNDRYIGIQQSGTNTRGENDDNCPHLLEKKIETDNPLKPVKSYLVSNKPDRVLKSFKGSYKNM